MITSTLLLLAVSARTVPLNVPRGLRDLKFALGGTGVQVGRAQKVRWSATTEKDLEIIFSALSDWRQVPPGRGRYERKVGNVQQSLSIGTMASVSGKRRFRISIEEEPPEDGAVPDDWPLKYRGGLVRIYPSLFSKLRAIDPFRVEVNYSPVGFIVTGTYRVRGQVTELERIFEREVRDRGWVRVVGKDKVRLRLPNSDKRFVSDRLVESVGLAQQGSAVLVEVRWFAAPGDLVGTSRPEPIGTSASIPPGTEFSRKLMGNARDCRILPVGHFGGRALSWSLVKPVQAKILEALARRLGASITASRSHVNTPMSVLTARERQIDVRVEATPGRLVYLTEAPSGWRRSRDFAGFWMPRVVDASTHTTVTLTERRAAQSTSWPKEACFQWPPADAGVLPLQEMMRQPDEVQFPTRPGPDQLWSFANQDRTYAKWIVRPSSTRKGVLEKFSYPAGSDSKLESVNVTKSQEGAYEIRAVFR